MADDMILKCLSALDTARRTLLTKGKSSSVEVETTKDVVTQGDLDAAKAMIDYFTQDGLPAIIKDEEKGTVFLSDDPKYLIAIDDIDGSDGYAAFPDILPHCSIVAIYDSISPNFSDVLVAGMIEHTSGHTWYAKRGEGTFFREFNRKGDFYEKPVKVTVSGNEELTKRTRILFDMYMTGRDIVNLAEICEKGWVKDFGCSAFNYIAVVDGKWDVVINSQQKAHELGAGFLLVKEAGGFIGDWELNPIDDIPYDFDAKYEVLVASSRKMAEEISSLIKK